MSHYDFRVMIFYPLSDPPTFFKFDNIDLSTSWDSFLALGWDAYTQDDQK